MSSTNRVRDSLKTAAKRGLARMGLQVRITGRHDWTDTTRFIPFETTLKAAEEAGLSVGDYIDAVMNGIPGATQSTIDHMRRLGVFSGKLATVLEIGPGSGRYVEKTIAAAQPSRYEIYETAEPWARYVEQKFGAIRQPTDGRTLAATPTVSVDLVQAHKVFSSIDFLPTLRYWREIARVTRPGGWIVFDVTTEACLDADTVDRWIDSDLQTGAYPAAVPRKVCTQYFEAHGCSLVGTFIIPMGPGTTEGFVFRKASAAS